MTVTGIGSWFRPIGCLGVTSGRSNSWLLPLSGSRGADLGEFVLYVLRGDRTVGVVAEPREVVVALLHECDVGAFRDSLTHDAVAGVRQLRHHMRSDGVGVDDLAPDAVREDVCGVRCAHNTTPEAGLSIANMHG